MKIYGRNQEKTKTRQQRRTFFERLENREVFATTEAFFVAEERATSAFVSALPADFSAQPTPTLVSGTIPRSGLDSPENSVLARENPPDLLLTIRGGTSTPEGYPTIRFNYFVESPSGATAPLNIVSFLDDNGSPLDPTDDYSPQYEGGDKNGDGLLQASESWYYFATRSVTINAGETITRIATIHAVDAEGISINGSTSLTTVASSNRPLLNLQLLAPESIVAGTREVIYTYRAISGSVVTDPLTLTVVDDNGTPGDTSDDFSPTYLGGDVDRDGLIDSFEAWTFRATRTVTLAAGESLTNTVSFLGIDDEGESRTFTTDHTLTARFDAPAASTLDLPNLSVAAGTATRTFNLNNYFNGRQTALTYTATTSDGTIARPIVKDNLLIVVFAARQTGTTTVTVTALDPDGDRASNAFEISVQQLPTVRQRGALLEIIGTAGNDSVIVDRVRDRYFVTAHIGQSQFKILSSDSIKQIRIVTGAGNDSVLLTANVFVPAKVEGGAGDDILQGGSGRDLLSGGTGHDQLFGNAGDDLLLGGSGNDLLFGGSGNDALAGVDGADRLFGDPGNDILLGGLGSDYLDDTSGRDLAWGGATSVGSPGLAQALNEWRIGRSRAAITALGRYQKDELDAFGSGLRDEAVRQ